MLLFFCLFFSFIFFHLFFALSPVSCFKHNFDYNSLAGEGTTISVTTAAEFCEKDRSLLSLNFPIKAVYFQCKVQTNCVLFYDFYHIVLITKGMPVFCKILGIKEKFKGKH